MCVCTWAKGENKIDHNLVKEKIGEIDHNLKETVWQTDRGRENCRPDGDN